MAERGSLMKLVSPFNSPKVIILQTEWLALHLIQDEIQLPQPGLLGDYLSNLIPSSGVLPSMVLNKLLLFP